MKRDNVYIIYLVITLLLPTACSDFLNQEPESKIPGGAIFSDPETINGYILGLYNMFRGAHQGRTDMYLGTDEAVLGGIQYIDGNGFRRGLETYSNNLNSTNDKIREIWERHYKVIARSTAAIEELKLVEVLGDVELNRFLGEACLMRATCLWEMAMLFGPIILPDGEVEYGGVRQPLDVVYKFIEDDLLIARKYLPAPTHSLNDAGRATNAFANALLGKIYMYAPEASGFRDYTKAADYFKDVIDEPYYGGTGADNYADIFDTYKNNTPESNKEIVYAFQYRAGSPYNNAVEWEFGSRPVADMTAPEGLCPWAGFDAMLPSVYCYSMVEDGGVWEPGDIRRDISLRFEFDWYDEKNDIHYIPEFAGSYVWGDEFEPHVKKYEDPRAWDLYEQGSYNGGPNIPYIRFSDVVLCYAECIFDTNPSEAIYLINSVVRKRAFAGSTAGYWPTAMSKSEFMEKLMDERMRELRFEGWRKFDLLRTGLLKEYVLKRNRWFVGGVFHNTAGFEDPKPVTITPITSIDDYKLLWPIPLTELRQNQNLTDSDQNPGYTD
ncbi:MAG: RagB/SusD family nutrient uptake outer membrane protein [Tannerellaceae bacterium]|nr:RagB/SusD family nutrient uptake outer membrane protein [Tannerellaceae bacterium]